MNKAKTTKVDKKYMLKYFDQNRATLLSLKKTIFWPFLAIFFLVVTR